MVKMEMKFSGSVVTAIDGLLRLHRGELRGAPVQPVWRNFRFPTSFKADPAEWVRRNHPIPNERIGSWDLTRKFEFFFRGRWIATVFLEGKQLDGDSSDNESFWGVRLIKYRPYGGQDGSVVEKSVYVGDHLSMAPR